MIIRSFLNETKYKIKKHIGNGCFGEVFLAYDEILNKDIAVKLIKIRSELDYQEAQIGNYINHQNLVKIHSAEYINNNEYIIIEMDFCENGSIENNFNSNGYIPLKDALKYTKESLRGLEALHGNSVFHNDIKPKNILIGSSNQAMLSDYGISIISKNKKAIEPLKGFYKLHCAPETFDTKCINVTTDIYQMGLTLFRLTNGNHILQGKFNSLGEIEYNELIKKGALIDKDDYQDFIPRCLKSVISKATDLNPEKRYQSAREMRHALEQIIICGDWNISSSGNLFGEDQDNIYTFEKLIKKGKYEFRAFKENKKNGRKTQIHKYNKKDLTSKNIKSLRKHFMQDVVNGNI